jgi:hypothetical protein
MKKIDLAYRRIMATKAKYGILALKKRNSSNSLALKKNQEGTASSSPSAPLQLVQKPTP